jgi:hypothetical protein
VKLRSLIRSILSGQRPDPLAEPAAPQTAPASRPDAERYEAAQYSTLLFQRLRDSDLPMPGRVMAIERLAGALGPMLEPEIHILSDAGRANAYAVADAMQAANLDLTAATDLIDTAIREAAEQVREQQAEVIRIDRGHEPHAIEQDDLER